MAGRGIIFGSPVQIKSCVKGDGPVSVQEKMATEAVAAAERKYDVSKEAKKVDTSALSRRRYGAKVLLAVTASIRYKDVDDIWLYATSVEKTINETMTQAWKWM